MARCIGIFDSGVGGLTVVKAVRARLPDVDIIYLGDTARLPYGNKSPSTVEKYSRSCLEFLLERGAEAVAIACNTASATARQVLQHESPVPVIDAVTAGAERALAVSKNRQIGVIATRSTVASGAYQKVILDESPAVVQSVACPLLVPLAEEGWVDGTIPTMITEKYFADLHKLLPAMDTLILGCTHYPLLAPVIANVVKRTFAQPVHLVDGAESMADRLAEVFPDAGGKAAGTLKLYATDATRLVDLAKLFLGEDKLHFEVVDL